MNFTAINPSEDSEIISLSWTSPASDSAGLTYAVKRSEDEIITQADFDGAVSVSGAPAFISGTEQGMEVEKNLSGFAYFSNSRRSFSHSILVAMAAHVNYYCFAIQIKDADGVGSEIVGDCYVPSDGGAAQM